MVQGGVMPTDPRLWPLKKLLAAKKQIDPQDPIEIRVPRYQRGLVWDAERKKSLIESLYRG